MRAIDGFGQAYLASGPWPKVTYHSIRRSIDYDAAAMRGEVVLSRAEPQGGGGYPLSGQQRNACTLRHRSHSTLRPSQGPMAACSRSAFACALAWSKAARRRAISSGARRATLQ